MSILLNLPKSSASNHGSLITSVPNSIENRGSLQYDASSNIKNSIFATPSELVSTIVGYSGNQWDKNLNSLEFRQDTIERFSESSSSVIFEESPDILILNKNKLHGRKERFSREFAINLKKLRAGRYSEYIPRKNMKLQIDEDVQPQITTLRDSNFTQRKRTESCYPRLQHQQKPVIEIFGPSLQSVESRAEETVVEEEKQLYSYDGPEEGSAVRTGEKPVAVVIHSEDLAGFEKKISYELGIIEIQNNSNCEFSRSYNGEASGNASNSEEISQGEIINNQIGNENLSRSIDSIIISIDGKIFKYFDKTQLCGIPVLSLSEYLQKLKSYKLAKKPSWTYSQCLDKLSCVKKAKNVSRREIKELEMLISLRLSEFEPTNELHLILLLGAYTGVTGETDWPSSDSEWLNMGLSSSDILVELSNGGLIGLLFTLYLSSFFSGFLKEMLGVSRYYSFDVFQICKYFAVDTVDLLRAKRLHKCFNSEKEAIDTVFLFYSGMVIHWFSIIVKNKDFDQVYNKIISKGKSAPQSFIDIALSKLT